jgi:plasmid stabilization system protein ParE
MKKFKVVVLELTKTDIRKARKWYNEQQAGLGKRLTADMTDTLRKVAINPTSFAVGYKVIRLANFETFPYAAHFYIDDKNDTVFIIAILHSSRHPDTFKDRI